MIGIRIMRNFSAIFFFRTEQELIYDEKKVFHSG